jgi:hypothetical protein
VEATVDNLKLLGEETARKLIGPRGYRRGEDDDEDGRDQASRDAVKLRWGALLKLAKTTKSSGEVDDDTTQKPNGGDEKKRAAALRALGDSLSFPLSVVAASWMFPIVYYTLSIAGGVGKHARDDYDEKKEGANERDADAKKKPAPIHLLGAAAAAAANAPLGADWWPWLVGFGCKLPAAPGLELVAVGEGVKTPSRQNKRTKTPHGAMSFIDASYASYVAEKDARSPYLIFAGDLMREADVESIVASALRSPAPLVTTARTEMELAMESELMRDAGYELVGVEKNPFAAPVPSQSPAMANDAQRANEWLAVYVPARGAPRASPGAREGRKREGDAGNAAAKRRK